MNNILTIKARELRLCVSYLREKSAPLTNFQPNWATKFGNQVCLLKKKIKLKMMDIKDFVEIVI